MFAPKLSWVTPCLEPSNPALLFPPEVLGISFRKDNLNPPIIVKVRCFNDCANITLSKLKLPPFSSDIACGLEPKIACNQFRLAVAINISPSQAFTFNIASDHEGLPFSCRVVLGFEPKQRLLSLVPSYQLTPAITVNINPKLGVEFVGKRTDHKSLPLLIWV